MDVLHKIHPRHNQQLRDRSCPLATQLRARSGLTPVSTGAPPYSTSRKRPLRLYKPVSPSEPLGARHLGSRRSDSQQRPIYLAALSSAGPSFIFYLTSTSRASRALVAFNRHNMIRAFSVLLAVLLLQGAHADKQVCVVPAKVQATSNVAVGGTITKPVAVSMWRQRLTSCDQPLGRSCSTI